MREQSKKIKIAWRKETKQLICKLDRLISNRNKHKKEILTYVRENRNKFIYHDPFVGWDLIEWCKYSDGFIRIAGLYAFEDRCVREDYYSARRIYDEENDKDDGFLTDIGEAMIPHIAKWMRIDTTKKYSRKLRKKSGLKLSKETKMAVAYILYEATKRRPGDKYPGRQGSLHSYWSFRKIGRVLDIDKYTAEDYIAKVEKLHEEKRYKLLKCNPKAIWITMSTLSNDRIEDIEKQNARKNLIGAKQKPKHRVDDK